ncbi:MAG: TetR/AcrR family transcriptional regulator [Treponema sp.]|nr:TetR/AcrR family transcriptional regulator [Treponema sp.]
MAIIVEHDKRKQEILQKSLDVFIEEGYEDATFQKIADRCGITRTTLYIYFKNKHEIFLGSIKELLAELENSLKEVIKDKSKNAETTLRQILTTIISQCEENSKLFSVLLNYLMQLKKSGVDTNSRVRRRVIRMHHILVTIIIQGIRAGEFKDENVKVMEETLYALIESAIFRIAVLNQTDLSSIQASINRTVDSFLV